MEKIPVTTFSIVIIFYFVSNYNGVLWYGGDSRRVRKEDMRRIAKATGASIVTTLADMEGNESFDPEVLGEAEEVSIG